MIEPEDDEWQGDGGCSCLMLMAGVLVLAFAAMLVNGW